MFFFFQSLMLLLIVLVNNAISCTISLQDYTRIKVALGTQNYFQNLTDLGLCNKLSSNSLQFKYNSSCLSNTLQDALLGIDANCNISLVSILFNGADQSSTDIIARANEVCMLSPFSSVINNFLCSPSQVLGCPKSFQIARFVTFLNCYQTALNGMMNVSQQNAYFNSKGDVQCILNQADGCLSLSDWKSCPLTMNQVFQLLDPNTQQISCANEYPVGTIAETRCNDTFSNQFDYLCAHTVSPTTMAASNLTSSPTTKQSHAWSGGIERIALVILFISMLFVVLA